MSQKDKNTNLTQVAFDIVDKMYGKSHKITPPPYIPKDEFTSRFNQNSCEYFGPKVYTTSCHQVSYQYSNVSTIKESVVSHPTEHIQYFGRSRPIIGHANRFEKQKGRAINCDEAVKLYGGVLIKEFRN